MNQQNSDQAWRKLPSHIESFLSQAIKNDVQKIEYQPRYVAMLAMPSDHEPDDLQVAGS